MKEPKDGMTRVEYLETLPKDKDGHPIIEDKEKFLDFAFERGWDYQFGEWIIDNWVVDPKDYDEFYQITYP